jgi:glycosyltransferase involved in cell wall biosynthesis
MRFHLIAPPNTQLTRAYALDGFTQATIRFAKVLKELGHFVIIYGSEECDAPYDELVQVVSKAEITAGIGDSPYQYAAADNKYPLWELANKRIIEAIQARKQPRDFICLIGGDAQKSIADAHPDLMTVEYSIGYEGTFASYRVYESHAWRHTNYAKQGINDGRFFDTVVPLFFDPEEYPFRAEKEPFVLYVGRLTPRKGIGIACEAAAAAGIPLKVIGHGDKTLVTHGAEYLGELDSDARNQWMSRASAVFCPTQYIEPFGSVAVEAQFCGTPVITTDFGAYVETVEQGKTGWRCNYLGEFVDALRYGLPLDPTYIRSRAVSKYSIAAVQPEYKAYFDRLMLLWDQGWSTVPKSSVTAA